MDRLNVATSGGWTPGDMLVLPCEMSEQEADRRFGDLWEGIKPYLRVLRP